jgi:hypothetical protein
VPERSIDYRHSALAFYHQDWTFFTLFPRRNLTPIQGANNRSASEQQSHDTHTSDTDQTWEGAVSERCPGVLSGTFVLLNSDPSVVTHFSEHACGW